MTALDILMADQGVTTTFCDGLLEAGNGTLRSLGLLLCSVLALLRAVFVSSDGERLMMNILQSPFNQFTALSAICAKVLQVPFNCFSSLKPYHCVYHWIIIYHSSICEIWDSHTVWHFLWHGVELIFLSSWSVLPGSSVIGFCFISFPQVGR